METLNEFQERIAKKIAAAKWPDDVPKPEKKPKLRLSGLDGNAFVILGRAVTVARNAKWTAAQIEAFRKLARAGDYGHILSTCMDFFEVR